MCRFPFFSVKSRVMSNGEQASGGDELAILWITMIGISVRGIAGGKEGLGVVQREQFTVCFSTEKQDIRWVSNSWSRIYSV